MTPVIYKPNSRRQEMFLASRADIAIMGGARGGGKTFGLQLDSSRHLRRRGFYGALLRSTLTAVKKLGGMWDEGQRFYRGLGGTSNRSELSWTFPSGAKLAYGHLETEASIENWRGAQVGWLGIDQLETIKEHAFWAVTGSIRSATGVNSCMRATCNPNPDCFLYKNGSDEGLISWWINTETGYPIQERAGVLRWFVRDGDRLVWADSPNELASQYPTMHPTSVTFVPATVYDNTTLLQADPGYLARLQAMPYVERMRMLGGNWKIKAAAGTTLRPEWFRRANQWPERFERVVRVWDLAGTEPSRVNPDPDWCAGCLAGLDERGNVWLMDMQRFRASTGTVEDRIAATAERDGHMVEIFLEQEGGSAGIGWPDSIIRNRLVGFRAKRKKPQGSKLTRAQILGSAAEHNRIYVPDDDRLRAAWLNAFLSECGTFTDGTQADHDDQVDAASAAVIELTMGEGQYTGFSQDGGIVRLEVMAAPPGVFMPNAQDTATPETGEYGIDDDGQYTIEDRWPGL